MRELESTDPWVSSNLSFCCVVLFLNITLERENNNNSIIKCTPFFSRHTHSFPLLLSLSTTSLTKKRFNALNKCMSTQQHDATHIQKTVITTTQRELHRGTHLQESLDEEDLDDAHNDEHQRLDHVPQQHAFVDILNRVSVVVLHHLEHVVRVAHLADLA